MGEGKRVFIIFLVLLFIIIGVGVLFSRLSKNKKSGPILGGVLDNIFFSKSLRTTPTPTPYGEQKITIRTDSETPSRGIADNSASTALGTTTKSASTGNTYTDNPNEIPATGTPTVVLVLSGMGASAGIFLKRFK